MPYRKKLIEVALPLDAINAESAREKSIRHGHPSTLHLWWARRPLAACRAVLFSQLVDDPSEYMPDEKSADEERERLFDLIEELVLWENINNEEVLDKARLEIARSVARDLGEPVPVGKEAIREFLATKAPPVLDPFAGGGSIPLEAQRLGLRAYASDLNPVAVLINKALIEIPPKFANMPPVHPLEKKEQQLSLMKKEWKGTEGLAEDVRYYGKWMRDEAEKRIGDLYPKYKITQELLDGRPDLKAQGLKSGDELTVIAWLWARTVKCPNPACGVQMPLVRSFALSSRKGKEAWVEPVSISNSQPVQLHYLIKVGHGINTNGTVNRNGARCIACNTPVPLEYVRSEGRKGELHGQMMAIVADSKHGRVYLPPTKEQFEAAILAQPTWRPDGELPLHHRNFQTPGYGMGNLGDLFTPRQVVTLTTLSDLIGQARQKILDNSKSRSFGNDYANAIATYLAFGVNRTSNTLTSIARWTPTREQTVTAFSRQAIPMTWDYPDVNPFAGAAGDLGVSLESVQKAILGLPATIPGIVNQADAKEPFNENLNPIFSTDPPYYDNICYADLSDFFYVWLRRSLNTIYPNLFATMLVPKSAELVATPHRFLGDRQKANLFFEEGLRKVFSNMDMASNPSYPVTIFYAFKQTEEDSSDEDILEDFQETRVSTGWETMLEGLITSGFEVTGTWPMRSELSNRPVASDANALASSIVLVCRPRITEAGTVTRREFLSALRKELAQALRQLQLGNIAPVDFAQAAIGPGMAIYSRHAAVLEADGSSMRVRNALALINQALDDFLSEQEGEYDSDTRWALAWYEQYGQEQGPYGVAETLSKAKNTSVGGLGEAGILVARSGKVRLLSRTELKEDWDPSQDKRPTAWEAVQYLIWALDTHGEQEAALLLSRLGGLGEVARDLAYRLYTICERKGWAQDALGYNMLVVAWPRLKEMVRSQRPSEQRTLL